MTENSLEKQAGQEPLQKIHFIEQGLFGFESLLQYELSVYDPQTPFYWLRSVDQPDVAFIVMEPAFLLDDYQFDLPTEDAELLKIHSSENTFVLVICTIPENPLEMTANLLGPILVNRANQQARQLTLDRHLYPLRFPVFDTAEQETSAPGAEEAPEVAEC